MLIQSGSTFLVNLYVILAIKDFSIFLFLFQENFFGNSLITCSIWGPTCDSLDLVSEACLLPSCLNIGDWILFESMGAYTIPTSTNFNGFAPPKIHHICDFNNW